MTFGAYVKDLRKKCGLSLRRFCSLAELDASNWSKVERGLLPPPKSRDQINDIASVLALPRDSEECKTLLDLAAISHMPTELMSDKKIAQTLPMFFRTMRSDKPSPKEVRELFRLFKK
jgi:transcriptional regulator with XRE-family HTH domain